MEHLSFTTPHADGWRLEYHHKIRIRRFGSSRALQGNVVQRKQREPLDFIFPLLWAMTAYSRDAPKEGPTLPYVRSESWWSDYLKLFLKHVSVWESRQSTASGRPILDVLDKNGQTALQGTYEARSSHCLKSPVVWRRYSGPGRRWTDCVTHGLL